MNVIDLLSFSPWVDRLGWTLVHFLWQGLAIAILYAAARRGLARSNPNARHALACAAMAAMMAAPLVTWGVMPLSSSRADAAYQIPSAPLAVFTADEDSSPHGTVSSASLRAMVSGAQPAEFLPWVVIVWLAGAVIFWIRLAGGWVVAARMRSMQVRPAPPEWQKVLRKLGERISLSRPVELLVSALVQVPTVVGWLRPVVLVPVGALSGLPAGQVEVLLLHELAHIRRHDYLVNLLQSVAEALLFYHPAVWWISAHIRVERELCCDDVVVSASGDALTYARALVELESRRPAELSVAVAANGGSLSDRIARLLGQSRPAVPTGLGPGLLTVAILLAAAAYGLFGQSDAQPAFQSASIKRNTSNWSDRFRHPMGMGANASLMLLIQFSYAPHDSVHSSPLPTSLVVGGPPWIDSEGYDIDVKPGANSNPKQIWMMWQRLLADRFKLKLRRESREIPVYVLSAAENGLKLPAPKKVVCVAFPPGTKPRHVPGKVDCGNIWGPFAGSRHAMGLLRMEGSRVSMADFAARLALIFDRPVLNQTGFTGEFDLNLSFTPDGLPKAWTDYGGTGGTMPPTDANGPNIFAALQEQLGLKLVAAEGPVEVLVIDHAERPTEN